MSHDCIFCRIAAGSIPSHGVFRSANVIAFMDIRPIRPGHVLVAPVAHHRYFDDMPDATANEVFAVARRLAPRLRELFGVERVGLFFTGVDVAHAHAHLVPMVETADITSAAYIVERPITLRQPPVADGAALAAACTRIRESLSAP